MNISEYFRFAELAQAAYYDLQSGIVDPDVLYDDGDGMAKKQAEDFADNWTVLDQYDGMVEDTYYDEFGDEQTFLNPTGLSVTLFDDGKGNQVVAIRGTDDLDDFVTDFIDIALLGTTEFQAQYSALSAQVQTWIVDGTLQSDFSVVGHSLGGFLAQALTGEFDSYISHTYTYNAPGFTVQPGITNIATEIMDLLGIANASVPEEKITNIRALEGIFATAGLGQMIGDIQVISIEDQAPSLWANHYMVNTVDSLAVYNLFAQVDSTLTIDEVTGIIRASSNKADHTLESAVTALGKLFVTGFTPRTGSEYDANRDNLYTDIDKITDELENISGLSIEVFATTDAEGKVTPFSPSAIETQARNNIAYRYALVNLNPFAVVGPDSMYDDFNQNGELDIFDPSTGDGQLSDKYLTYRTEMLSFLIEKSINDGANQSIIRFEDKASGEVVLQQGLNAPQLGVVFGSEQGEELNGTSFPDSRGDKFNDRLYGMGGNDTLLCGVLSAELTMSEAARCIQ